MSKTVTLREVDAACLDLTFDAPDVHRKPVSFRSYFKALVSRVVEEDEGFSGKRPFGNSGWICDLEMGLVQHGLVKGQIDQGEPGEHPELVKVDSAGAQKALQKMIALL